MVESSFHPAQAHVGFFFNFVFLYFTMLNLSDIRGEAGGVEHLCQIGLN